MTIILDDWQAVAFGLVIVILSVGIAFVYYDYGQYVFEKEVPDCDVRLCERLVDGPEGVRYCEYFSGERAVPYYARCEP
jgi:hypothetical protein